MMEVNISEITSLRLKVIKPSIGKTNWLQFIATDKDGKLHEVNVFPPNGKAVNLQLDLGEDD